METIYTTESDRRPYIYLFLIVYPRSKYKFTDSSNVWVCIKRDISNGMMFEFVFVL